MHKKIIVLAALVVAAAAFAVPSMASAQWAKNTKVASVNESVTFTVTDPKFEGSIGGTTCENAHSSTTLTPGTTGHINSFTVANAPAECSTSGLLGGCTVTAVESTTGTPWVAHNTTSNIHITGVKIHNYVHGTFCPYKKLTLKGDVTVTADNPHHVGTGDISGTLSVYNGESTAFITSVEASGEVHTSPSAVYGLTPTE